jgi:hypothetical protein
MTGNRLVIIRETRGLEGGSFFDPADADAIFHVLFNPSEYTLDSRNQYSDVPVRGLNTPLLQYSRGSLRSLAMSIVLDTYASGPDEERQTDVRARYIRKLERLQEIDGELHRPPMCKVVWGTLDFTGFLVTMDKRFTLFLNDGTPVRAHVSLRFEEAVSAAEQLEQIRFASPDKVKEYTVVEGDTIWEIAARAYGDAGLWRPIAEANDIEDPRRLPIGLTLLVPALGTRRRTGASSRISARAWSV